MKRLELTRLPLVKPLLRSRWPQFLARSLALAGFLIAILAGLLGTPVGNRNFAIVFVWIAWWALLILITVPLFGRGWCSICPIPMPGEWLQQGNILGPAESERPGSLRRLVLGRRWPKPWRNIWLQNGAFTLVALFSTVVLTQPFATGIVLAGFLIIAIITSLVYERRAFCRYLCPVGGFIGLYSQLAPVELRVKDTRVCAAHTEKTCYTGNAEGYGCPWQVFPGGLVKNTYCGTCMECLRTCPHDNIAINLRSPGVDLYNPSGRKLDETYKAFIMLGSALVYTAVLLGPWGLLKSAANQIGSIAWFVYVLAFITLIFFFLPGLFYISVAIGRRISRSKVNLRKTFIAQSDSLVPLGLTSWVSFSLSFVFANFSYVWPAISDPFGWGWNLTGGTGLSWTPYWMNIVPAMQVLVLSGGLSWASQTSFRIAAEQSPPQDASRQAWPVVVFCTLATLALLVLLVG